MTATATKASPSETSRAYRTRAKKRRGQATPAELAWLDRYEQDHQPVRPTRASSSAPPANDNEPASSPPPASASASSGTPPPIDVPETKAEPSEAELAAKVAADAEKAARMKADAEGLAGTLCEWLAAASKEVRELGGVACPDWAIGRIVFPCLTGLIMRTAPMEAIQDERAQAGVCVVAFGGTFAQRHVLRRRLLERGGTLPAREPAPPEATTATTTATATTAAAAAATGAPLGWR